MNPWLFSFLVSFALLLLLADRKRIRQNIYGGILAAVLMQAETILAAKLDLFEYNFVRSNMPDMFLFSNELNIFLTGIAFNAGILTVQYLPERKGFQLITTTVWTLFLLFFNILSDKFELINYMRFKPYFVLRQLMFFLFLAWIRNNFAGSEANRQDKVIQGWKT